MADNTDESRERSYHGESPDQQQNTPSTSLAYIAGVGSDPGKRSLWQEVRDREIEDIIRSVPSDPSQVASVLIQTAMDRNSRYNVSAIVVSVLETHGQMPGPGIQCIVSPNRLHLPQEWLMFFTDKEYNPRTR
jgi:hypothetical protein